MRYHKMRGNHADRVTELGLSEVIKGKRVLDIGCNTGYLAAAMRDAGATAVTGIDISKDLIVEARRTHRGIRFKRVNVRRGLPPAFGIIGIDRFDVVVAASRLVVLEQYFQMLITFLRYYTDDTGVAVVEFNPDYSENAADREASTVGMTVVKAGTTTDRRVRQVRHFSHPGPFGGDQSLVTNEKTGAVKSVSNLVVSSLMELTRVEPGVVVLVPKDVLLPVIHSNCRKLLQEAPLKSWWTEPSLGRCLFGFEKAAWLKASLKRDGWDAHRPAHLVVLPSGLRLVNGHHRVILHDGLVPVVVSLMDVLPDYFSARYPVYKLEGTHV